MSYDQLSSNQLGFIKRNQIIKNNLISSLGGWLEKGEIGTYNSVYTHLVSLVLQDQESIESS